MGLWPLACWDCGFESRTGVWISVCCALSGRGLCVGPIACPEKSCGCLSVVIVVCCAGRGLCDGLITRPEESYGCLSVVSDVCCQVDVSVSGRSLVQRSPTECGVSECDRETSIMRGP